MILKQGRSVQCFNVFLNLMKETLFIALSQTKTKHLLCRARINGIAAVLLIDTGASNSCIHSKLQDLYKLKKKGAAFDAAGASEGKMTAVSTHQCELILGRHQVGKHTFVLLDLSHINETLQSQGAKKIDGIIGADFLIKHKASIDYRTRKLSL